MKRSEVVRRVRRKHCIPIQFVRKGKGSHEIWGAYGRTMLIPKEVYNEKRVIARIVSTMSM